ncbi:MAG: 4Fe-4S dicluster domain-containing protein [Chloroflexi bacterium]|nr:4Fe-4S dicluster domain-containing protein [Chloroflexota bacterium]
MSDTLDVRSLRHAAFLDALAQHTDPVSRRRFIQLMGASLAIAGAAACAPPHEQIVPYVRQPAQVATDKPLFFASAHVLGGFADGVLVQTQLGRPTKIEGNPQQPASLGATDAFGQASVLTLYEPTRAQTVTFQGQINTWNEFQRRLRAALETLRSSGGQGIRFLSGSSTSPTLAAQIGQLGQAFPNARWHWWEPVNRDTALAGAQLAFGQPVEPRYHFDAADVVLSLDADTFAWAPGRLRYMHDFATRRRPEQGALSRVYAVESTPSLLGAAADHRLPLPAASIQSLAFALAAALQVNTGAPAVQPPAGVPSDFLTTLADDLRSHGRTSLVVPGDFQPPAVHAAAHAINAALGSVGTTVDYASPVLLDAVDHVASLRQLVDDMSSGQVALLVILDGNPVYSAPADVPFRDALQRVGTTVHVSLFEDETSEKCQWHVPALHALEDWSDARGFDGTTTILQPTIAPLYSEAHSVHEVLATFSDAPATPSHDIVKAYWQTQHPGGDFDAFWRQTLSDGVVAGSASRPVNVTVGAGWAASVDLTSATPQAGALEIAFRPDPSLYDGQFATNGWLLELPRPLSKLSWDNVVALSPATASQLGVTTQDVVELSYAGRTVRAPVWVQPGQADGTLTVTLGYGRQRGAGAGATVGFNANAVRTSNALWFDTGLQAQRTGETHQLVSTQGHHSMEGHDLVVTTSQQQLQAAGNSVAVGQQQPETSLYPAYPYPDNKWGMVIDLNSCVGCNACIVACQAENNIPVVGKDEVGRGREMLWLRVDTYYENGDENPRVLNQLVPCMQCEDAPCELVCPVGATVHSTEGLNDMVYNRCVGTRYCSNNCPYKVRRFNFFQYTDFDTPSLKLLHNPQVTVRSRGVMEKCTYCTQRISAGRIQAEKENRPIHDGEVLTACQAACPTNAIVFGNLNDPNSQVAHQRGLARNYTLLAELNTKPRTTYLATVPNPNPSIAPTV